MAGTSTREIKNRIRSMKSTRQITRAMEMVAAARLRHAQAQVSASRPYFEILRDTIDRILEAAIEFPSPYLTGREVKKTVWVVIAGDRGLAGGYNSNVLKQVPDGDIAVLPIGKKAVDYFKSRKFQILTESYAEAADVSIGDCFAIAGRLCEGYLVGVYDEIVVAYTGFESVLSQIPTTLRVLPLPRSKGGGTGEILYEPNGAEVFEGIVPQYLGGMLYGALCESCYSEQAARRAAMDSATRNADDLIADLSLKFNQARQAAITQEITEIVAGS